MLGSQDKTVINNKAIIKCLMRTRTLPISPFRNVFSRNSLVAQLLGLGPFTAVGLGLMIPGPGTKIPEVTRHGRKKKKRYFQNLKQINGYYKPQPVS